MIEHDQRGETETERAANGGTRRVRFTCSSSGCLCSGSAEEAVGEGVATGGCEPSGGGFEAVLCTSRGTSGPRDSDVPGSRIEDAGGGAAGLGADTENARRNPTGVEDTYDTRPSDIPSRRGWLHVSRLVRELLIRNRETANTIRSAFRYQGLRKIQVQSLYRAHTRIMFDDVSLLASGCGRVGGGCLAMAMGLAGSLVR